MDKNQNMLINAMCLYTVPEVMKMSAIFSGLSDVLEKAMTGFVEALSGQQAPLELSTFFSDEMDDLVVDVIEQLHQHADELLKEYNQQLQELQTNGAMATASQHSAYFEDRITGLQPLDQLLTAKDVLAYVSLLNNEDAHSKTLIAFIDCFAPVFEQMEASRIAEAEQEAKKITSWFSAAKENDVSTLAMLHSEGLDIESRNDKDKTALALAVINNSLEAVSYLCSKGASPVRVFTGDSPISIAIENNYADIVAAIFSGEHEELKQTNWESLITNSSVDIISDEYCETLLHILAFNSDDIDISWLGSAAIKKQAHKLFAILFDYGLDANDEFHAVPLIFITVNENNLQSLTVLIKHGVDINQKDGSDESLLEIAVEKGSKEIAHLLIDAGIKLEFGNHYTSDNFIKKLSGLINSSTIECLRLGLFDPAAYDNFGRTFIHVIVSRYDEDDTSSDEIKKVIDVLINEFHVDINQTTEDGCDTALTLANHQMLIESLFTYSPNVSEELSYNKSVISKLTEMLGGRALAIGIKAGINPNVLVGELPILHYCFKSNPEHISLLIEQGADLDATDNNNLTVLQKWIADKERIEPYLVEMAKRGANFSLDTETGLPIFHALSAVYDGEMIKKIVELTTLDIHVSDRNNNNAIMQACLVKNDSALMALTELGVDVNQMNSLGGTPLLHAVYIDNVELFSMLVKQCGAKTDIKLVGKNLTFIANQLTSYDVWNLLLALDKKADEI